MSIDFTQNRPETNAERFARKGSRKKRETCDKFHPKFIPGMLPDEAFCVEDISHRGRHKNRRKEVWNEGDEDVRKPQSKNQEGPDDYIGGEEEY